MANIFAGLENLGLKNVDKVEVFQEEETAAGKKKQEEKKKGVAEEDLIFDKKYTCPVCDCEFTSKMVRSGRVRLTNADSDLRPIYQGVDSLKYDAILCGKCGYAALNRYFNFVMPKQKQMIKEKISSTFTAPDDSGKTYSYEDAIMRHKMALLNTIVKSGKNSERAYTCLKLAWLHRGQRELMMQEEEYDEEAVKENIETEQEFLANAFEGFEDAYGKEDFPMCGMDQYTMMYLLAELARRIGKEEEAMRYCSKVLVARDVNKRIKDKAIDLKEKLRSDRHQD